MHEVSDLKTEKEIGGKSNEVVWEKYRLHLSWYSSYVLFRRIHLRKIQVEPRGCCCTAELEQDGGGVEEVNNV